MNRTKIEWCDYTLNPVKGLCPMACSYCYARRMYQRFKWNPEVRYVDPFWLFYELKKKPPSRIFVGSTIELFGEWVRPEWIHNILGFCAAYRQHTFLFLTKQPLNLIKWSPFPENCYVGVTATNPQMLTNALYSLLRIEANVKFISFEPLLLWETLKSIDKCAEALKLSGINWVIIGAQTKPYKPPRIEWVREIVQACDKAGVAVFLKDNLRKLFIAPDGEIPELRQELPK